MLRVTFVVLVASMALVACKEPSPVEARLVNTAVAAEPDARASAPTPPPAALAAHTARCGWRASRAGR